MRPAHLPVMRSITLNQQPRKIAWTFASMARLGSLPNPPELSDLTDERKSPHALACFAWAMLAPEHHAEFPTPDAVARGIPMDGGAIAAIVQAIVEEVSEVSAPAQKKRSGCGLKRSPASSSA